MTASASNASIRTSLKGIWEIYLIVLGIGITEALTMIPEADCNWNFFSYTFLLFGYLSTVLRFSLETVILFESNLSDTQEWNIISLIISISCLLSAITFFLMGHNLVHLEQFILYTIGLLGLDMFIIFLSDKPWQTPHPLFLIQKGLSILSGYRLFPSYYPLQDPTIPSDQQPLKKTHYQWVRHNLYLICCLWLILMFWNAPAYDAAGDYPISLPQTLEDLYVWVTFMPQKLWLTQTMLALVLLLCSFFDLKSNYRYYFRTGAVLDQRAAVPEVV